VGDLFDIDMLNALDFLLIGILLVSLILGLFRGLVREVLALCSWVLAGWLTWRYGATLGDYLMAWLSSERLSYFAGLGAIFTCSLVIFTLISRVAYKQFRISGLTTMNRVLGAIFGIARGLVLSTLLLFGAQFSPAIEANWYRDSELIPYFAPLLELTDDVVSQQLWNQQ
jgi:membrane protein required for colicin V production